ncbi:MAG: hypothetical protein Q4E89_00605 [Eubacteriales bacterium]|nr:hypothetical protein [Eubacteriales bacterium]
MKRKRKELDWYEHCRAGEGICDWREIADKLNKGKQVTGIYLITLSENPDNILEMFSAVYLSQSVFRERCPKIVGVAKGKDGAIALVRQLVEESWHATGSCRVNEYLKSR